MAPNVRHGQTSTSRKGTLFEAINRIEVADDGGYITKLVQELVQQSESAVGFRHSAASTQATQDRTLNRYIEFLKATRICAKDATEEESMKCAFPEDLKALYLQVRIFVIFAAKSTHGRAIDARTCTFQSLTKLRSGLMFHAIRSYDSRDVPAPPRWILYNKITEALRYISKDLRIPLYGDINKSQVGLPELSQLIDFDMQMTRCFPLAESHHLAWCIGRICAVRPGSLGHGPQDKSNLANGQFLRWGDIEVFRNGSRGEFIADITFRVVKTNQADPEEGNNSRSPQRPIRCRVMPPKSNDNLVFSVPHRLLVIALRRGAIEGVTTLEELLTGNGVNIMWKEAFLDKAVLLGGTPRGLSLSETPMSSPALSYYIGERGRAYGYERRITFYSIRNRIASDLTALVGADHARRILNHSAESHTLEHYYLDDVNATNLTAMALGEDFKTDAMKAVTLYKDLSTTALGPEVVREVYGEVLNGAIAEYMLKDDDAPSGISSNATWKNYRRKVSRIVFRGLLHVRSRKLKSTLTPSDVEARIADSAHGRFMREILEASKALDMQSGTGNAMAEDDPPAMMEDGGFEVAFNEGFYEPDIDSPAQREAYTGELITRRIDEGHDGGTSSDNTLPYLSCVTAFMDVLLHYDNPPNPLPLVSAGHGDRWPQPRPYKNNMLKCIACVDDPTVDDAHRQRVWKSPSALQAHQASDFHTPRQNFWRATMASQSDTLPTEWICPFCSQLEHPESRVYPSIAHLMKHVERSTLSAWGSEHDRLKIAAGVSPKWGKNEGTKASTRHERKAKSRKFRERHAVLQRYGIVYAEGKELEVSTPTPHPYVVAGGPRTVFLDNGDIETTIMSPTPELLLQNLDEDLKRCIEHSSQTLQVPFHLLSTINSTTI